MDNTDVEKIKLEFVKEAINSPTLISDLANMEKYISESYDGRSLIELLQNADDAMSTKFYIEKLNENTFLVANNGRIFNQEDLISLCRSGASTKKRKGNTIGFRGIGFKSIVNFSNEVHLISGDIRLTFSRERTRKELNQNINVPLIRIPHSFIETKYNEIINKTIKNGYTTIFIFETNKSTLKTEIDNFDKTCMLFLKNICQIKFDYDKTKINSIARNRLNDNWIISINTDTDIEKWLLFKDENKLESIAFKYENDKVIAANDENYIHSFMPTKDTFSIPCKINGDFSTDPSRTRIIIDDESLNTINNVAKLMSKIAIDIVTTGKDNYKILSVISKIEKNILLNILKKSINDYFFEYFKKYFIDELQQYFGFEKIFIQPIWLSNEDFSLLQISNEYVIKRELLERIDGLEQLLNIFKIKEIELDDMLNETINIKFDNYTRLNILKNLINRYEFNLPNDKKIIIDKALLFKGKDDIIALQSIKSIKDIDVNFLSELINLVGDERKVNYFLQKFNIKIEMQSKANIISNNIQTFSKKNIIQKWRSVEENVKLLLEEDENIIEVIDVSKRNIGYDLEAICKDGKRKFYEVKSVNDLGDMFVMTNNELLTASQHPSQYFLCVVKQSDRKIEMCLIKDPANTLNLEKRARVWEYICESYNGIKIERTLD